MRYLTVAATAGALLLAAASAEAQVVTPNANASTEGAAAQFGIFASSPTGSTFQTAVAASQFSSIPIGNQITGIGFRLDGGSTAQVNPLSYTTFQLQIGQSANPVGSLSNTFASNLGADTVLAINGLSVPAGSFVDAVGVNPNPFYVLLFGTPYTYNGGDLLVTVRQAGNGVSLAVDAVAAGGVTGTVANFNGPSATVGDQGVNFFNAPVMEFIFGPSSAVPEPSTWAMMLLGFGAIGLAVRRRRAIAQAA